MKKSLLTLMLLLSMTLLASCGGDTNNNPAQTSEPAMLTSQPENTVLPGLDDGNEIMLPDDETTNPLQNDQATGVTSMDKARRAIEQLEEELERLSEVKEAKVLIAGHKAAVALEFDTQYQAGIDDRLRGIVQDRVDSVIGGIDSVQVTADPGILEAIDTLQDGLESVSDMSSLQQELDRILEQMNAPDSSKT